MHLPTIYSYSFTAITCPSRGRKSGLDALHPKLDGSKTLYMGTDRGGHKLERVVILNFILLGRVAPILPRKQQLSFGSLPIRKFLPIAIARSLHCLLPQTARLCRIAQNAHCTPLAAAALHKT